MREHLSEHVLYADSMSACAGADSPADVKLKRPVTLPSLDLEVVERAAITDGSGTPAFGGQTTGLSAENRLLATSVLEGDSSKTPGLVGTTAAAAQPPTSACFSDAVERARDCARARARETPLRGGLSACSTAPAAPACTSSAVTQRKSMLPKSPVASSPVIAGHRRCRSGPSRASLGIDDVCSGSWAHLAYSATPAISREPSRCGSVNGPTSRPATPPPAAALHPLFTCGSGGNSASMTGRSNTPPISGQTTTPPGRCMSLRRCGSGSLAVERASATCGTSTSSLMRCGSGNLTVERPSPVLGTSTSSWAHSRENANSLGPAQVSRSSSSRPCSAGRSSLQWKQSLVPHRRSTTSSEVSRCSSLPSLPQAVPQVPPFAGAAGAWAGGAVSGSGPCIQQHTSPHAALSGRRHSNTVQSDPSAPSSPVLQACHFSSVRRASRNIAVEEEGEKADGSHAVACSALPASVPSILAAAPETLAGVMAVAGGLLAHQDPVLKPRSQHHRDQHGEKELTRGRHAPRHQKERGNCPSPEVV